MALVSSTDTVFKNSEVTLTIVTADGEETKIHLPNASEVVAWLDRPDRQSMSEVVTRPTTFNFRATLNESQSAEFRHKMQRLRESIDELPITETGRYSGSRNLYGPPAVDDCGRGYERDFLGDCVRQSED